jgi:hypothetical protein
MRRDTTLNELTLRWAQVYDGRPKTVRHGPSSDEEFKKFLWEAATREQPYIEESLASTAYYHQSEDK